MLRRISKNEFFAPHLIHNYFFGFFFYCFYAVIFLQAKNYVYEFYVVAQK